MGPDYEANSVDIAVIGMSCRFPKANNIDEYWENLSNAVETVRFFTDDELLAMGVDRKLLSNKNYVKAASVLDDCEMFDAEFFGYNPREVICMDPQHRLFLECSWETFENSGYIPNAFEGAVGVFAGLGINTYVSEVMTKNKKYLESISNREIMLGNDKDFLPMRVSYKLNLRGPSININTACSTSLVSIHLARQSLLLHECDMAVAGGVSILLSNRHGYLYVKDDIQSPDGHCRAFDAKAEGTIWGDGCGTVLLKRMTEALEDGDHIYAVIKGSAVNNDGSLKAGYTAPSVEGQSRVIVEALAVSDLGPEDIGYIEAHGTGTKLGDPIEIEALVQAFKSGSDKRGFCPIGSVKTNMGHLNAAAGIAGFIKTVLALQHRKIPPSLHFERENSGINFENSPFYVNTELKEWKRNGFPLRGGISSMGIGGTNAHVILEEAPRYRGADESADKVREHTIVISARSVNALNSIAVELANYLEKHTDYSLDDVAFTLKCGRTPFSMRRAFRCASITDAVRILRQPDLPLWLDSEMVAGMEVANQDDELLAAWLRGETVDWSPLYHGSNYKRVPLPTYPFERKRFWIEPDGNNEMFNSGNYFEKLENMADWFYIPSWRYAPLSFVDHSYCRKCRLVFVDSGMVGKSLVNKFRDRGDKVITVHIGKHYDRVSESAFILNPGDFVGFCKLYDCLDKEDLFPEEILFLWTLDNIKTDPTLSEFEQLVVAQQLGLFSIMNLVKALVAHTAKNTVEFVAVTNTIFDISGSEQLCVENSTISGICMVTQQEYSNVSCRMIDIDKESFGIESSELLIDNLVDEISYDSLEMVCAYRGKRRYLRQYDPVRIEENAPRVTGIERGGVYLVYSGLEGIGFLVSEDILRKGGKLLILEEDGFPDQREWAARIENAGQEDPTVIRIQKAKKLMVQGSAHYMGTLSEFSGNYSKIEALEDTVGKVKGIIHAPGASNYQRLKTIKDLDQETWRIQFEKIAYSLMRVDKIFENREVDFRIVLNSLGSIIGGVGFLSIATVSNYIKAYVNKKYGESDHPWVIQCWDSWIIEWGQAKEHMPGTMYDSVMPSVLQHEEGLKCFQRLFALKGITEVDISATSLSNRYNKWVKLETNRRRKEGASAGYTKQPRPESATCYEPPQNEVENVIGGMFSDILGIEELGRNDNFFEFGGQSLLAIQLASKLREQYPVDIDLYALFELSTTAKLAEYIEQVLQRNSECLNENP